MLKIPKCPKYDKLSSLSQIIHALEIHKQDVKPIIKQVDVKSYSISLFGGVSHYLKVLSDNLTFVKDKVWDNIGGIYLEDIISSVESVFV